MSRNALSALAKKIYDFRKGEKLARPDFAKKIGISIRSLVALEQGKARPTRETLRMLAAVIGDIDISLIELELGRKKRKPRNMLEEVGGDLIKLLKRRHPSGYARLSEQNDPRAYLAVNVFILRNGFGLSRELLSKRSKIARVTLWQIERGVSSNAKLETLIKLSKFFGVDMPELFKKVDFVP